MPYMISAARNTNAVIIDEIDNGIHEELLKNLLFQFSKKISGQMILTTHNTRLLNEYAFKDSFFFINVDENGNRSIMTPVNIGYRIQKDSNVITNYNKGKFGGFPKCTKEIDIDKLCENI